jgi:hypothetical protein
LRALERVDVGGGAERARVTGAALVAGETAGIARSTAIPAPAYGIVRRPARAKR